MKWVIAILIIVFSSLSNADQVEAYYRFTCMPELSRLEFSEAELDGNIIGSDIPQFEEYDLFKDGIDKEHVCKFGTDEEWKLSHINSTFSLYLDGKKVMDFHLASSRGYPGTVHRLVIQSRIIEEICGCNTSPFECIPVVGINRDGTYNFKEGRKLPIDLRSFFTK